MARVTLRLKFRPLLSRSSTQPMIRRPVWRARREIAARWICGEIISSRFLDTDIKEPAPLIAKAVDRLPLTHRAPLASEPQQGLRDAIRRALSLLQECRTGGS